MRKKGSDSGVASSLKNLNFESGLSEGFAIEGLPSKIFLSAVFINPFIY